MTKEDKFKIALFYYKKHGSMVHYGKIFDNEGHIKPNVNLNLIEECIKTDPYIGVGTGCSCDTCIHCQSDFCSLFDKGKECKNFDKWHFPYAYWRNVMERENNYINKKYPMQKSY